jgi:predicted NBD/HSP70 family sugar kinase
MQVCFILGGDHEQRQVLFALVVDLVGNLHNVAVTTTPGRPRLLRAMNDRTAFELLLDRGPLSRTALAALTGLAQPTVAQLLGRLEAAGLVVPAGIREGGRGPSAKLYAANPRAAHVAGVDVTADRISVAVADLSGELVAEHVVGTPRRVAVDGVARLRSALEGATAKVGLRQPELTHVVVGLPGAINPRTGELLYAPHLHGWHQPDLLAALASGLGTGVDVENDVNLAALAEMWLGEARDVDNFVLLWAEEGLGLALVLDGRVRRGATGGAGEISYLPVAGQPLSRDVGRGGHGGFQLTAGAAALLDLAHSHGVEARSAAEAVALAVRDDRTPFLREVATRLATGLAAVACLIDPELVVLGGDVPRAGGDVLLDLIAGELRDLAAVRPRLALSSVPGNLVRTGALRAALIVARAGIFPT